ncbi:MAG: uroporphyrinogen-III C-methyltransferase [Acidimicrobiales bacterium]
MTVHLVGAGPGDAELLTLRAARLLSTADAVVFDRLIGDEILDLVTPSAERYPVGKQPGRPSPPQESINDLLVDLGHRLETVVRVKGGDPYLFGRGIEERRALENAGLAVDVVPGISSALAAPTSAGVSVTERGVSSGVCIVTAHQDDESKPIDWAALASSGLTIVVLMGARRAALIRDLLIAGGLSSMTPTAVVTDATRLSQATWRGPLHRLGQTPVASPSVLVIGEVAAAQLAISQPQPALVGRAV